MPGSNAPATIVISATVPQGLRPRTIGAVCPPVPVTWLAPWDGLAAAATLVDTAAGSDLALEVPAGAFDSWHRLRTLLARGREARPELTAIAVRGPAALEHRGLLVEEGIRVVLVDSLPAAARGSRRPAPGGWRCRNAVWGLWEVEHAAVRRAGPLGWLGLGGMPGLRPRSLAVLRTEGLAPGNAGAVSISTRLQRWLAWARRHVDRGAAEAVTLQQLAARLSGDDQAAAPRSVLRAA